MEKDLEQLLHDKIPISKEMQIQVNSVTALELQMLLPLTPNRNHKATLFGGSLYSGSALACYGLFLHGLRHAGVNSNDIVIAEGQIKYLKPVDRDALVVAQWPDESTRVAFFDQLQKKGKARIAMRAEIQTSIGLCAEFVGQFVARL